MPSFELNLPSRIVFGRGRLPEIGELAAGYGRRALVVTNASPSAQRSVDRLKFLLSEAGVSATLYKVEGEPEIADVDRGSTAAREGGCDLLIGLGGGSAIDAAKAIAGLLTNEGAALDYMEVVGRGRKIRKAAAPWIAVPVTAGTGAEVTRNAVIASREKKVKASIRSAKLLPSAVVVDAELGVDVTPEVTACAGMDALTQLIESYTTKRASPVTDALALEGMGLASRALKRVWANGRDVEAREDMALAAMLSGLTLANAGLGAVHGFAAPLGGRFPAPHGAVCAALLPHVMRANADALLKESQSAGIARYARVGRILSGKHELGDQDAVEAGVIHCESLARELHIPRLGEFGITEDDIPDAVAAARRASSMKGNPVLLSDETLKEVLRRAVG